MKIRTILFLPAVVALCACEQAPPEPAGDEAAPRVEAPAAPGPLPKAEGAEQQLLELEERYVEALKRKDRDFLMRFYAPDWRGGNWMGFWTKSTMLRAVLDERYVVKTMELRDMKVRVNGRIGIVQGVDDEVTAMNGRDTSGKWSFTDVFEYRDGNWVAIASHTAEVKPAD